MGTNGNNASVQARFLADLKRRLEPLTYEEREALIRAGKKVLSRTRSSASPKAAPAKRRVRAER